VAIVSSLSNGECAKKKEKKKGTEKRIRKISGQNKHGLFDEKLLKKVKRELGASAKFLAAFFAIFFLLNIFLLLIPLALIESIAAFLASFALQAFGIKTQVMFAEPVKLMLNNTFEIEINYLCTGLLESTVLVSGILASLGIDWRKRACGALTGLLFVNALNIIRIVITALAIVNVKDAFLLDFIHNILFKLTLFVGIAGFYALWFCIATKEENKCGKIGRSKR